MENATYATRMRYLDADDVVDPVVDYDGLDVYGTDGHKLGDVDGFIVDREARRVNYIVIDSGGWFTSRRLLLPIGHASLAADRKSLQADVTRESLRRLPEYDEDRFAKFSDEELRAFERNTVVACCPDEPLEDVSVTSWGYDTRRHYSQPEWWNTSRYAADKLRDVNRNSYGTARTASAAAAAPAPTRRTDTTSDLHNRELVTASGGRDDVSPHLDGRAQPGDVLGLETGGETTALGETSEDENKRRRGATEENR